MDTNTDRPALAQFVSGFIEDGMGPDGLPLYRETVKIIIARPPLLRIERVPEAEDYETYAEEFELFRKKQAALRAPVEGYPLAMWPAMNRAELENCAARDIVTVEQLATLAGQPGERLPPAIRELSERARQMMQLQKEVGQFEAIIGDLRAQLVQLQGELKEAHGTISAQMSMIDMMKQQASPRVA